MFLDFSSPFLLYEPKFFLFKIKLSVKGKPRGNASGGSERLTCGGKGEEGV